MTVLDATVMSQNLSPRKIDSATQKVPEVEQQLTSNISLLNKTTHKDGEELHHDSAEKPI